MKHRIGLVINEKAAAGSQAIADIETEIRAHQAMFYELPITREIQELEVICSKEFVTRIVAVGGDGTVNFAAQLAIKLGLPLGVIPMGTFNHFAKDCAIPLELAEAVHVVCSENVRDIDYATVNDCIFVNNSSIGVYPNAAQRKAELRHSIGKWLASVVAFIYALRNIQSRRTVLNYGDRELVLKTPSIFVSNNTYNLNSGSTAERSRLDTGHLFVQVITTRRLHRLLAVWFSVIFNQQRNRHDVRFETTELKVNSSEKQVLVAVDGEVIHLSTPLLFKIWPQKLRVLVSDT